ncbi:transcriptional regulator, TetR family [Halopseudomonas xinjiangensis]|uniref:Transcriptional regulator, TetR family n=1 Tax=Halopseudomonas xinjiangensis TaxID=487184 RepID=A0A1H1XJB4_9GAMM|nr:TetR/AcrR family transcriptional regulator [Halopseudomonas xinjiangensis]SDT09395.1 transcriptional regulator, TetR family [Halopseudomonas xinjiangensis]
MESKVTDYHHGQLRGTLLKAARETLEQNGASALSLRDLARRIGVSHAAPYRHFASRDDLLAALAEKGFHELAERLRADAGKGGTLKGMGLAYVEFATGNPSLYKLMFSPGLDRTKPESLAEAARSAFELLQTQSGSSERDQSGTLAAWSLVHGLSQLLIDRLVSDELLQSEPLSRLVESVLGHLQVPGEAEESS